MPMFILILRAVLVIAVLTVIYLALSIYMRWDKRKTLQEEYHSEASHSLTEEDYVNRGLSRHRRSIRKQALLWVFALPFVIALILVFLSLIS
jgi:uncharacterized iron-regulated membrane protein